MTWTRSNGWNYLRVRGEYPKTVWDKHFDEELPPRARRIRLHDLRQSGVLGTTSACAENTLGLCSQIHLNRNYLRVRGEYAIRVRVRVRPTELPPRARRIHSTPPVNHNILGTTSACAENTPSRKIFRHPWWNYLRVRGEYRTKILKSRITWELPPRARRIRRGPENHCQ